MTPTRINQLRIKLGRALHIQFPRASVVGIGLAVNALMPLILRESLKLVEEDHEPDCACWHCVLSLNSDITRHMAELRAAREAAEDHD